MIKILRKKEVTEQVMKTMRSMVEIYVEMAKAGEKVALAQVSNLSERYLDWVEALPEGETKTTEKDRILRYFSDRSTRDTFYNMGMDFAILACMSNEENHFADPNDYPDTYEMMKEEVMRWKKLS